MTARDPEPIAPKLCPLCQQPARETTPYEFRRTGKPCTCDPCALFFDGTATEFARYRAAEMADAAERMASSPKTQEDA